METTTLLHPDIATAGVDLNERPQGHVILNRGEHIAHRVATPQTLVEMAITQGLPLDQVERYMRLKFEWDAAEARNAFTRAMARFKKNPPVLFKDKRVSYEAKGGVTQYDHATLGHVCERIVAALAEQGISHSWTPERKDGRIYVTCTLTHEDGHSQSVTLDGPVDDSGGKNAIQAVGSTITYLQRYTLLSITGIAVNDGTDDDGVSATAVEATRNKLVIGALDGLMAQLKATTTDAAAKAVWDSGSKALYNMGSTKAYDELKEAVVDHRQSLKKVAT